MTSLVEIPSFHIEDTASQQQAAETFGRLGVSIPAMAIHVPDLGQLHELTAESNRFDNKAYVDLTPQESAQFHNIIASVFTFCGIEIEEVDTKFVGEPYAFEPVQTHLHKAHISFAREEPLAGSSRLYTKLDGGCHNDTNMEGLGSTIYGAHLTTHGTGIVRAGIAPYTTHQGVFRFMRAEPTHTRNFQTGDVHLFVRQAPKREEENATAPAVSPTTHDFITTSKGRIRVDASYRAIP